MMDDFQDYSECGCKACDEPKEKFITVNEEDLAYAIHLLMKHNEYVPNGLRMACTAQHQRAFYDVASDTYQGQVKQHLESFGFTTSETVDDVISKWFGQVDEFAQEHWPTTWKTVDNKIEQFVATPMSEASWPTTWDDARKQFPAALAAYGFKLNETDVIYPADWSAMTVNFGFTESQSSSTSSSTSPPNKVQFGEQAPKRKNLSSR
jgi:hypothetical protein